jgi:hypothetical protein
LPFISFTIASPGSCLNPFFPGCKQPSPIWNLAIPSTFSILYLHQSFLPLFVFLDYPTTLPLLPSGAPFAEVSIPRDFAYVLLANTFLGNHECPQTYPEFQDGEPESWGDSSWLLLMLRRDRVGVARLKCQLAYFQTVANLPSLEGSILLRRASADFISQIAVCETIIPPPVIHIGVMEDRGNVIVDFANQYLHINRIIPSATQEEILFSVRPECLSGADRLSEDDPNRRNCDQWSATVN